MATRRAGKAAPAKAPVKKAPAKKAAAKAAPDVRATEDAPPDVTPPFEGAVSFEVTSPVILGQLESEISDALNKDNLSIALTGAADPSQVISEDNPATLWISSPGPAVDSAAVEAVIADHQGQPDWGVPQVMKDFETAVAKLTVNPDVTLTADEQTALLKGVVLRSTLPV